MKAFIKRNRIFAFLIIALVIANITILSITIIQSQRKTRVIEHSVNEQEEILKNEGIIDFVGQYDYKLDQISFIWHHNIPDSQIESIKLFYRDNELIDVSNYSSYQINRATYNIVPGENQFKLLITKKDNTTYNYDAKVLISYVVSLSHKAIFKDNSVELEFKYSYAKNHPVNIPNMIVLDDVEYNKIHKETKVEENGEIVNATTYYTIKWKSDPIDSFSIRLFFEDINESFDFTLSKENSGEK